MDELRRTIEFLKLMGYSHFRSEFTVEEKESTVDGEKESEMDGLEALKKEVLSCCKCRLCKNRTNVVFGEGNPKTNLMLIGEAPGEQEDLQGRPFVGRAGQLLTRFLNLYGVSRDRVYITNIVKCRPPGNRNPAPDEIRMCYPYLEKQIELISPKVILCLGAFSARTILNLPEKAAISKIRGKPQEAEVGSVKLTVIPTFHPAYLLRNRRGEPEFQKDLELALKLSGFLS